MIIHPNSNGAPEEEGDILKEKWSDAARAAAAANRKTRKKFLTRGFSAHYAKNEARAEGREVYVNAGGTRTSKRFSNHVAGTLFKGASKRGPDSLMITSHDMRLRKSPKKSSFSRPNFKSQAALMKHFRNQF